MTRWVEETFNPHFRCGLECDAVLYEGHTGFQDLIIFENKTFGRVMMLDGVIQLTERDEFIYHEMMAHVPLFSLGDAETVLIIGGGDGGVLREVLKHRGVSTRRSLRDRRRRCRDVAEISAGYLSGSL